LAKKTKKTGAGGKSVQEVRAVLDKISNKDKAQSVVNVPVKPSTQKGLTKKKRHGLTEQQSKSIDDRYLKEERYYLNLIFQCIIILRR
jgi:hypothetical protein